MPIKVINQIRENSKSNPLMYLFTRVLSGAVYRKPKVIFYMSIDLQKFLTCFIRMFRLLNIGVSSVCLSLICQK